MNDDPIVIKSASSEQLGAALRQLLVALGAFAAGKGWIDESIATALVSVLLLVGPVVWSQLIVRRDNATKAALADALPDSIARVKP